jgi:hypothetical protein
MLLLLEVVVVENQPVLLLKTMLILLLLVWGLPIRMGLRYAARLCRICWMQEAVEEGGIVDGVQSVPVCSMQLQ